MKVPELLSPAGTIESLYTAFLYGADAVYCGIPGYSMRARSNISIDEMSQGIKYAHSINKKVYFAFNIFAHERDFENLSVASQTINFLKPDGLIISDLGILRYVKKHHPEVPIHISTQANICSSQSVKAWQDLGASLCVLSREVTHREFLEIRDKCPDIKLEIFIHGSMCMSYSGRCLISNYFKGRPSNRGLCYQPCRSKYRMSLMDEEGHELEIDEDDRYSYIMNSKDLCLMPKLSLILESGVDTLKIEGRNRSEYYTGSVTRAYRLAIDSYFKDPTSFDYRRYQEELDILESRGYSTAFFDGAIESEAQNYASSRSISSYKVCGVIRGDGGDYITMELRNEVKKDDEIYFLLPDTLEKPLVKLGLIIDGGTDKILEKKSAGQGGMIKIPKAWIDRSVTNKLVSRILAYKKA